MKLTTGTLNAETDASGHSWSPARQTAASLFSVILSFLASSHHWLHMALLTLFGGSMASMSQFLWIRRFMIVMVLVTVLFTVYRLVSHRCRNVWMLAMQIASVLVSVGFVVYTLVTFGW
jgi:hypothetical protein